MLATLVTLALVAMTEAVYAKPAWALYYLFAGVWTLVFLALTPLILKALMFDRRPLLGLGLIGLKLVWLGLMFAVCLHWSRGPHAGLVLGTALVAGVTTPLLVVALRAAGVYLNQRAGQGSSGPGVRPGDSE